MSYQLSFQQHHDLVNVLAPFLIDSSEPKLSIAEAQMAGSALIDLLAPKICEIVDAEVLAEGKRIALATGRG